MLKNFSHKLAKWIPTHVSAKLIVGLYMILDKFSFAGKKLVNTHYEHNVKELEGEKTPMKEGFIENQNSWKNINFGKVTMAFAGCEIIAVYNVLHAMGKVQGAEGISKLISHFERKGAALHGKIGTSPLALRKYLSKQGIKTRLVWKEERLGSDTNLAIVTMYNNCLDLYDQIHTVAYTRVDGKIVSHNAGSDKKQFDTLAEAVKGAGKNAKMICALEIEE